VNGSVVQSKIAKVLKRLGATSRVVQFRSMTATGGNATLGLGRTVTSADTPVDPQPAVELVKLEEIAGGGSLLQLGDYRITFAGSVPESTLTSSEILYGTDILKVVSYEPVPLNGVIVCWRVIARTVKV
jgi:hypothetical protein